MNLGTFTVSILACRVLVGFGKDKQLSQSTKGTESRNVNNVEEEIKLRVSVNYDKPITSYYPFLRSIHR